MATSLRHRPVCDDFAQSPAFNACHQIQDDRSSAELPGPLAAGVGFEPTSIKLFVTHIDVTGVAMLNLGRIV